MPEDVLIRDGQIKDKNQVVNLWIELHEYSRAIAALDLELAENAPGIWVKFYESHVSSRNKKALVAEREGKVVGYLLGSIKRRAPILRTRREAFVTDLFVTESERRKGIGTRLIESFGEWARGKGMRYVTLSVLPENELALEFYDKRGFETILKDLRKMLQGRTFGYLPPVLVLILGIPYDSSMKVEHMGYARRSRNGRALKLDLSLHAFLTANRYTGKDGKEYVGLVINMSRLLDVLEGRREVTNISQIENER